MFNAFTSFNNQMPIHARFGFYYSETENSPGDAILVDVLGVDKIFKFVATILFCSTLMSYGTNKEIYAK